VRASHLFSGKIVMNDCVNIRYLENRPPGVSLSERDSKKLDILLKYIEPNLLPVA